MKWRSIYDEFEPTHAGYVKPAYVGKRIETVVLEVLTTKCFGRPIYLVITDSFDPPENNEQMINRAWHVFNEETFAREQLRHPDYIPIEKEFPWKVKDFIYNYPNIFTEHKEFHMFEARWVPQ